MLFSAGEYLYASHNSGALSMLRLIVGALEAISGGFGYFNAGNRNETWMKEVFLLAMAPEIKTLSEIIQLQMDNGVPIQIINTTL